MDVQAFLNNALTWRFLGEPFWRWFFFLVLLMAALGIWYSALRHMRAAVD